MGLTSQVNKHAEFQTSRCFYVVSVDGAKSDFSAQKCLQNFIREKYPEKAESFIAKYFKKPQPRAGWNRDHGPPRSEAGTPRVSTPALDEAGTPAWNTDRTPGPDNVSTPDWNKDQSSGKDEAENQTDSWK